MTGVNTWPEIIEPCQEEMQLQCEESTTCALVVGVAGLTADKQSSYRLKGFYGTNKLYVNQPVVREVFARVGDKFDYYWFVITDAVNDPMAQFEYQVSVSTNGQGNPDLFVSLLDGRSPTENDYDFASTMEGADSIRIASNSSFWAERGWE